MKRKIKNLQNIPKCSQFEMFSINELIAIRWRRLAVTILNVLLFNRVRQYPWNFDGMKRFKIIPSPQHCKQHTDAYKRHITADSSCTRSAWYLHVTRAGNNDNMDNTKAALWETRFFDFFFLHAGGGRNAMRLARDTVFRGLYLTQVHIH